MKIYLFTVCTDCLCEWMCTHTYTICVCMYVCVYVLCVCVCLINICIRSLREDYAAAYEKVVQLSPSAWAGEGYEVVAYFWAPLWVPNWQQTWLHSCLPIEGRAGRAGYILAWTARHKQTACQLVYIIF